MKSISHKFISNYERTKTTKKDGTATIYLRVGYDRQYKFIRTGVSVSPRNWDKKKQRVRKHANTVALNLILNNMESRLQKYKIKCITERLYTDLEQIEKHMLGIGVTEDAHEFFQKTLKQHPGERSTIKKHEIILNYLYEFSPVLPFGKINYAFVKEFYNWLSNQKSNRDKSKTLSKNYVASMMTTVRYYTNQAILNGLINKDPFLGFSPVKTKSQVPHLTIEEVKAIEALDLSMRQGSIEDSRNAFVFSCYTGLRFSDLFNLKTGNIKRFKGDLIMNVEPIKTKNKTVTIVRIPLSKAFEGRPAEIITPYLEGKEKDDLLFGKNYKTHTSTYNQHLRKIQDLAGIEVPLRSHIGRHTCAMMLINEYNWDIAKVQTYLGHADIGMTQKYGKVEYRTLEDGW